MVFVSGHKMKPECHSYSYSSKILGPNGVRIRIHPKIWVRILFVFVFGQFSQIEYYSYLGNFSNRILFVFVFGWLSQTKSHWDFFLNTIDILLSIDTIDEWAPILHGRMKICHRTFTFLMTGSTNPLKNELVSVLLWVLGAAKSTLCAKLAYHSQIPESHWVSHIY